MKKLTIYDIATLAGVSKSTVSRFLNGGYVSQTNKEKIEKIVAEHNFKRSDSAVSLRTKENQTIGIIVPRIDSYASSNVVKGILKAASQLDFNTEILTSDMNFDKEIESYQKLKQRNVKGIIALATNMTDDYETMLAELGLPVVVFGQECHKVSCVYHDVSAAVEAFCQSLFPQSVPESVVLLGPVTDDMMLSRTIGTYQRCLGGKGIEVVHIDSDFSWQQSLQNVKQALEHSKHIVCLTDNIAYGAYKYAQQQGLVIGQDIHISGLGGYDTSSILTPELSTISFPYLDAGVEAVKLLTDSNSVIELKLGYTIHKTDSFSA
ncbi:LacI family transcriptional regulator [Vibrio sp. RE86]|uniref:LacI family DNA-binding transcriptional regulator n=1 Tax=Vibrio sp. RE86 TaxID=2607605 RepID=UPI001493AC7F|nr:LacI family DNA-binding transcriptional regulator [Vibrio sp. RE86]NOH79856.1 LacI family transcriptional regulator [Vibrio sp. RE86]